MGYLDVCCFPCFGASACYRPVIDFQLNFIVNRAHKTVHDFSSFTFVKACFTSQEMAVYLGVPRALETKAHFGFGIL